MDDASTLHRLGARIAHLQREKRRLKAGIKQYREALQAAATELSAIEAECRRRGLSLVITSTQSSGEGVDIHGHHDERTRA